MLVQCDESVKAIIEKIDKENQNLFIIESLDEETLLIAKKKFLELQAKLKSVIYRRTSLHLRTNTIQVIRDTVKEAEESGSE